VAFGINARVNSDHRPCPCLSVFEYWPKDLINLTSVVCQRLSYFIGCHDFISNELPSKYHNNHSDSDHTPAKINSRSSSSHWKLEYCRPIGRSNSSTDYDAFPFHDSTLWPLSHKYYTTTLYCFLPKHLLAVSESPIESVSWYRLAMNELSTVSAINKYKLLGKLLSLQYMRWHLEETEQILIGWNMFSIPNLNISST
jgi:hypothetical protein